VLANGANARYGENATPLDAETLEKIFPSTARKDMGSHRCTIFIRTAGVRFRRLSQITLARRLWFPARTWAVLPAFRNRTDFEPLNEAQPVAEILVAGPRECLFAGSIDTAEQGIENHVFNLPPIPIVEPGLETPAIEAFRALLREVLRKVAGTLWRNPHVHQRECGNSPKACKSSPQRLSCRLE
jgi:hypothetical protein